MKPDNAQVTVALAIVAALSLLGIGQLLLSYFAPGAAKDAWVVLGPIVGALAVGLNAPTGISAAISHITQPKEAPTP